MTLQERIKETQYRLENYTYHSPADSIMLKNQLAIMQQLDWISYQIASLNIPRVNLPRNE